VFAGLHHVQLAMPRGEEDRARAFYGGILGLTEIDKPPVLAARGGAWFRGGGLELHLGVEDPFVPARKAHPGILTDELDGVAARLDAAGVATRWDGDFPGHRRFYADDPFGNRLEFLQPI
jgi:catechol 2,3-dioxygenase-like lactoylglutathione lyase family enzyme